LRWFRIGDEGVCGLASALRDNWKRNGPRLRELDLRNNWIGDAGIRAFIDVLPQLGVLGAAQEAAAASNNGGEAERRQDAAAQDDAPLVTLRRR